MGQNGTGKGTEWDRENRIGQGKEQNGTGKEKNWTGKGTEWDRTGKGMNIEYMGRAALAKTGALRSIFLGGAGAELFM